MNGRLWPCGWALTGHWGSPIRRDNRVSSPGFAGTEPPEGLLENGDLRRDGARAAESWPLPCKSRDSSKMYTVVEHVEFYQDKIPIYTMTTAGVLVTLLFLSYSLLLERSCTERFGRLGLEELWRLRTASDRDQPAKQLIACTVTRGLQLRGILGNDSKLVMMIIRK